MRLQVLTHTYPRFTGDTNGPFVEDLCEAHAAAGHDVEVLTAFDPRIDSQRHGKRVALRSYRYAPADRLHVLGYSRTLEGDVRMRGIAKLLGPALLSASALALLRRVRARRPDVLHAHWILPNGFVAAQVGRLTGIPVFITLHGSDVFLAEQGALYKRMAIEAARGAAGITSCSPDLSERLAGMGADVSRVTLVPNGCDPAVFARDPVAGARLRAELGLPAAGPLVLALGRFAHKKGFSVLLQAAPAILAQDPAARLVIAGGGDLESDLRAQLAGLGLGAAAERVRLLGPVDRDRIAAYFSACDVFVMPSVRDRAGNVDGLPVVVLEAMAAGVPVVASNLTGIPLAVVDGETGSLVPPGDPAALAEAVVSLLRDPQRAARYGAAGRQRIEGELSWAAIAERHRALYREAL